MKLMSEAAHRKPPGSFALCESKAKLPSSQSERKSTTRYGEELDYGSSP
ncbi:hypothetical protein [Lysinibacillus sp. G4S2]|nr:hypothetical protein [Lysinibacillus sp. G4S2]MDM5250286.1 hypothetical protein [Lysinibacillus sp. G4S2]